MSYTRFLSEAEWNELIESKTFTIVENITQEMLSTLNSQRSLFFQTVREKSTIPYDRHVWTQFKKGSGARHQPIYRKMVIQECPTHAIRCISVDNEDFKKDIAHVDQVTYYHYFLSDNGTYREPEEGSIKKKRITESDAERVRHLLKQGSTKEAFELAKQEGIEISKRQCHNQSRYLKTPTINKTPRPPKVQRTLTMEQLELLKVIFPNDVFYHTDSNNRTKYQVKISAFGTIDHNETQPANSFEESDFNTDCIKQEELDFGYELGTSSEVYDDGEEGEVHNFQGIKQEDLEGFEDSKEGIISPAFHF